MRILTSLTFVSLVVAGAACGGSPAAPGGDDQVVPDANNGSGSGSDQGTIAFEVVSKDAMLMPGDQITYCYYFHTSNTEDVLVNKWQSDMDPGSHHAILFLNPTGAGQEADGTLDPNGSCGGVSGGGGAPIWTYATQTEHQIELLPADDGNGKPLAQKVAANTPAVLQLHYLNATEKPITPHIDLKAFALPAGTDYTQTDAYVTYNQDITVGPGATGVVAKGSCPVPAGVKFWTMSSHSHKQSVATEVDDGTSAIFASGIGGAPNTDWEHPGATNWDNPSFYTFTNSKLTWSCTYDNTGDNAGSTIHAGASAATDEMCMATGYFFPSTGPKFELLFGGNCINLN